MTGWKMNTRMVPVDVSTSWKDSWISILQPSLDVVGRENGGLQLSCRFRFKENFVQSTIIQEHIRFIRVTQPRIEGVQFRDPHCAETKRSNTRSNKTWYLGWESLNILRCIWPGLRKPGQIVQDRYCTLFLIINNKIIKKCFIMYPFHLFTLFLIAIVWEEDGYAFSLLRRKVKEKKRK